MFFNQADCFWVRIFRRYWILCRWTSIIESDVSVALFGNWRQEAIGNIIVALYLGAKVFLSHVNPVYEWAQSHGLTVYELEKLSQKELDTPLDRETKLKNRQILLSLYTKERMYRLIKDLSV